MKKIYIFDFDGVICNSYYECFLIAYKVVFKKNLDDFKIFYKKNLNRILGEYEIILSTNSTATSAEASLTNKKIYRIISFLMFIHIGSIGSYSVF